MSFSGKRSCLTNNIFPFLIQRVGEPPFPVIDKKIVVNLPHHEFVRVIMMTQDLIPKFYNIIKICFEVGLGSHNTINMTSFDEERVGTFI